MHATDADTTAHEIDQNWYANAFDALYPVIYAHRTVEAAAKESAFAMEQLKLSPTGTVLDLCCGNGRHMVHLLAHSPHVFGLDYSADLLGFARTLLGQSGTLLRGDMRAIPFVSTFDAVANFFTSFGYFQRDEENMAVAQGIARALKPGGRFFMDYLNPDYVRANLVPESSREAQDLVITERRWIDEETQRVNKLTEVHRDATLINKSSESVRLYPEATLQALLTEGGLRIEATYGDYDGNAVQTNRPRQIIVGTRG